MKTKIGFRKDAAVLVATSKQVWLFDQLFSNPAVKTISNILIRAVDFFNAKVIPVNLDNANKPSDDPESGAEFMPKIDEKSSATRVQPNIPDKAPGKEYIKVISSDGLHVGNIERVFADSALDQITHLLISKEIPAQERKLIPIKWVQTMGEAAVHLRVTKDLVEELADASIIW